MGEDTAAAARPTRMSTAPPIPASSSVKPWGFVICTRTVEMLLKRPT
jgi:hypothetical protein